MANSVAKDWAFLDLPPEIRNHIYSYAFTNPPTIDLFSAAPPSKALLLTCKQVEQEARLLYRTAYRAFWTRTTFTLSFSNDSELQNMEQRLKTLAPEDLSSISNLNLKITYSNRVHAPRLPRIWLLRDDVWSYWIHGPIREALVNCSLGPLVPPSKRHTGLLVQWAWSLTGIGTVTLAGEAEDGAAVRSIVGRRGLGVEEAREVCWGTGFEGKGP